jgi:hypothetical protein
MERNGRCLMCLRVMFVALVLLAGLSPLHAQIQPRPDPAAPAVVRPAAQNKATDKVDQCGGMGNIHDCHCAARVARVRRKAIEKCVDDGDAKKYNLCVRGALVGKSHCEIAERWTPEDGEDYISPEGDHVKTPLGEYCARACKRHRCSCAEEMTCDF